MITTAINSVKMKRAFGSAATQAIRSIGEGFKLRRSLDNTTSPDLFSKNFEGLGKSAYAGFDPTSDKLHLGNLLQVVSLLRSSLYGFRPIFLIGGATGKIGDPSGKSAERNLLNDDVLEANKLAMSKSLEALVCNSVDFVNSQAGTYRLPCHLQVLSNYTERNRT